jgi:hypothetical protein
VIQISLASDFYQPLGAYGSWVEIDGYGRCWQPSGVASGWRPYSSGYWISTDAGWCWQSSESFGWATYHYGRWNDDPQRGWYWVPQTQWAPAWLSWREGGGYAGWAPLPPRARAGIEVSVNLAPSSYLFVDERHFSEPISPRAVIVNNSTIINKTTVINETHVTNNVTFNSGPRVASIERATGQTIKPVPVGQVRAAERGKTGPRSIAPATAATNRLDQRPATTTNGAGAAPQVNRAGEDQRAQLASEAKAKSEAAAKARADSDAKNLAAQDAAAKVKAKAQADAAEKARAETRVAGSPGLQAAAHAGVAETPETRAGQVPPTAAQKQARLVAEAKAKADAKKKADAAKKEEEEKRNEENKGQQ